MQSRLRGKSTKLLLAEESMLLCTASQRWLAHVPVPPLCVQRARCAAGRAGWLVGCVACACCVLMSVGCNGIQHATAYARFMLLTVIAAAVCCCSPVPVKWLPDDPTPTWQPAPPATSTVVGAAGWCLAATVEVPFVSNATETVSFCHFPAHFFARAFLVWFANMLLMHLLLRVNTRCGSVAQDACWLADLPMLAMHSLCCACHVLRPPHTGRHREYLTIVWHQCTVCMPFYYPLVTTAALWLQENPRPCWPDG